MPSDVALSRRPRLAVLLGDPNGIGPEIGVKLLARAATCASADVAVYTDPSILAAGEQVAGSRIDALRAAPGALAFERGRPTLVAMDLIDAAAITPGRATLEGGRAAFAALDTAAEAAKRGDVDGIVFAPLNKHALRLAGLDQEDELRYLQAKFGVGRLRQRVQHHRRGCGPRASRRTFRCARSPMRSRSAASSTPSTSRTGT